MSHFNQMASQWDTPQKLEQARTLASRIKASLNGFNYNCVLDFGCGTGTLGIEMLSSIETRLLGVDTSEGMLEVLKQKSKVLPNIRSLLINLEEEIIKEKFDLIVSSMAFHHLNGPKEVLLKLKNMLNPGGRVVIVDLDQEDGSFHPDPKNMGVKHFGFSKDELQSWAQELGLKLEHSIVNTIEKNERKYDQFLAIYSL